MERPPRGNMSTGPEYEGFIVDILERLASVLHFQYYIQPAKDGRYGFRSPDGSWDGMVGELIRKVCIFH